MNEVLDCASCESMRCSAALLPFLKGSLRDVQAQRRFALREIFSFAPLSQAKRQRAGRSFLMLNMRGPCSVSHGVPSYT